MWLIIKMNIVVISFALNAVFAAKISKDSTNKILALVSLINGSSKNCIVLSVHHYLSPINYAPL